MNTYIQDKLDAISKKCASNIILSLSLPDEMIDYVERTITKNVQQSLTDYHNHIVEKIEGMKLEIPEYRNKRGHHTNSAHMKIRHNKALQMVQSLLQDTNPKE